MLSEELLKKVRLIEITTRKVVSDLMSGQYRSHFKGHGVQFSEHRQYVPGDDVRHIDWKASARTKEPLIKKFEEERELTVLLLVDVSGSQEFGSGRKLKSEVTAELSGMLAYAASLAGDKVGALLFSGSIEKIIRPGKGRQHLMRMIRDILGHQSRVSGTNLSEALDAAGRILKHRGIIFVVSDFIAPHYELSMRRLARKHEVLAVTIGDPSESQLGSDLGRLLVVDPETGAERWIEAGSYAFKKWLSEAREKLGREQGDLFKKGGVEQLKINTREDYADALVRYFRARSRRK